MKKQGGITLIALVITIIVLIILAGVALNLSLGENGLFQKTEYAKEQYKKAAVKEEIELAILDIQTDRVGKGESFNMDVIVAELPNKLTDLTAEKYEDITKGTYKGYNYIVKEDYTVLIGEEAQIKPRPIVFGEITWTAGKAQVEITSKTADTIEYQVNGTEDGRWITGTTVSNLNHEDIVYARTNNGTEVTEPQRLDIKDITAPESFTITVPEDTITYNSIKITGTATTDNQTGLRDYSFVVTKDGSKVKEITGQTVTEYTIQDLAAETEYVVYMLAYDNAGNERKSNEVTITTPEKPKSKIYGTPVNYNANEITTWQLFYQEEDPESENYGATYIILSEYLPGNNIPTDITTTGKATVEGTNKIKWDYKNLPTYQTITDDVRTKFMFAWKENKSREHIKCVSTLLNTTTWSLFANGTSGDLQISKSYAIGSPTIELWVKSWNAAYPSQTISISDEGGMGYLMNGSDSVDLSEYTGYLNDAPNVYFPSKTSGSTQYMYWIASPNKFHERSITYVGSWGKLSSNYVFQASYLRPVVYIPNTYQLQLNNITGMYDIIEK